MELELKEFLGISDQIMSTHGQIWNILPLVIILSVAIGLAILMKYNKSIKNYISKNRRYVPFPPTPYDNFELEQLQKIVDKLSRNFTILITIYGFLFVFIISQNFQHVSYSWTVIIWSGWVLAIIVRTANIALSLTDILETSEINKTVKIAASMIYAYNRYYKHTTYLLVFAVAFSPAVFLSVDEQHHNDFKLWSPQISILTIALGIISVFLVMYYYAQVTDLVRPGVPNIYFMSVFLLVTESLSSISSAPLSSVSVILLGYQFTIPLIVLVILFASLTYPATIAGQFIAYEENRRRLKREKNKTN